MRKNIIFSLVCSIVAFIVAFSMFCPNDDKAFKYVAQGTPESSALPIDGIRITQGEFLSDGTVVSAEETSVVVQFPVIAEKNIRSIEINYKEPITYNSNFCVELSVDGSFVDISPVQASIKRGEEFCCVAVEPAAYTAVRVWFEKDCVVENVSFYNTEPTRKTIDIKIGVKSYVAVAGITLLILVITFILDKKLKVSDKIITYFKKRYFKITCLICGNGTAIILGIITEIVFRMIYGADSLGNKFNVASCVGFCAVFVCVFILFFERKKLATAPEKALLVMVLAVGTLVILSQPMGHNCWDLDTHYPLALENSYVKTANYTEADLGIKNNTMISTATNTLEQSENAKQALNAADEGVVMQTEVRSKITHLPAGIFIAVARMFGADFYTRYICGQFANLLLYAVVCYFAVKKLKSGKMVAAAIVMFPTNILIASNYSYDHWVTAFTLLGICYFVSECEQPDKPITMWDTVVMCGAFAIGSLPKQIYILMMALPLFMHKNWRDNKARRNYYLILAACFVTVFVMLVMRSLGAVAPSTTGDTRGGAVNPSEQMMYILSSPFDYAKTLIKFLSEYLSPAGMQGYTTSLAYLGNGSTTVVFQLVLLFVIITGKNGERHNCPWWIRVLAILLYVGMAALMATALYIDFTPLKSDAILGCQPRYLIPLLAPVGLTVFGSGIRVFKNKTVYNSIVLSILCAATLFDIITLVVIPMM